MIKSVKKYDVALKHFPIKVAVFPAKLMFTGFDCFVSNLKHNLMIYYQCPHKMYMVMTKKNTHRYEAEL